MPIYVLHLDLNCSLDKYMKNKKFKTIEKAIKYAKKNASKYLGDDYMFIQRKIEDTDLDVDDVILASSFNCSGYIRLILTRIEDGDY